MSTDEELHSGIHLCLNTPSLFMTVLKKEKVDFWTPYKSKVKQKYDCVQNSLHFLDLIDEMVGEQQAELHNAIQEGTVSIPEVIFILSQKFKHVTFSSHDTNLANEESAKEIYRVLTVIPPGYAAYTEFHTKIYGHAVVIARGMSSDLFIIDPQICKYYLINTFSQFMDYITTNQYVQLVLIQFQKKQPRTSKTKKTTAKKHSRGSNIQIRKESFQNPTKRRRLNPSISKPKKSKTS